MESQHNNNSDIGRTLRLGESPSRMRRLKIWCIIALVIAAATLSSLTILQKTKNANVIRYETEKVQRGNLTVTVTATGTLQPTNKVDVGSELSGIIKSVHVDYNDTVKVGQVLARLDTTKLEAQATQSRSSLESAKAKVLQVQATAMETRSKLAQLQRVRELSNNKVPSQAELDAAEASYERAKADEAGAKAAVSQAQATLDANETDLFKSVVRSPINGVVLTRSIEPGQTVAATMTAPVLFTVAEDLTKMELHVNVDEADIGRIRQGQKASFTVAAYPNQTFEALITQARYGSSTTSGVVTYETVLKVNNSDLSLRPGMTATADITVENVENAILIPGAALRFTPPVKEERKSSGSLIDNLLPHPPKPESRERDNTVTNNRLKRIWILKEGALSSASITVGATQSGTTQVVSGDIQPGMLVVVDVVTGTK
jgi:HlyD family secretion protein